MATTTMLLISERWLDQVELVGNVVDVAGADISEKFALPSTLGDVAIVEMEVVGYTLATPLVLGTEAGVQAGIVSPDGTTGLDIVGVMPFYRVSSSQLRAYISPDPLVLWRQSELLAILAPELDINVTPTGHVQVVVKCVRVRPDTVPMGSFQLVR